jgi:hypothetical protein
MSHEERLRKALDMIERERGAFLAPLEPLSQNQMNFKPAADAWSIGEVAHHVGLTEQLLQRNVRELLEKGGERREAYREVPFDELPMGPQMIPDALLRMAPLQLTFSIMNRLLPRAVQSFLLANPIAKIRTAPLVEPKAGLAKSELMDFLKDLRHATVTLLEPVNDWDLSRFRWNHPLMGTHDVYGTLELLASHDQRHRRQVDRIKNDPKFPGR